MTYIYENGDIKIEMEHISTNDSGEFIFKPIKSLGDVPDILMSLTYKAKLPNKLLRLKLRIVDKNEI